jgi:hypothetical protein
MCPLERGRLWAAPRVRLSLISSLAALAAVVFGGCALPRVAETMPALDVSGVWEGASKVSPCGFGQQETFCNSINRITLSLVQDNSTITGSYRCEYGNAGCRHSDLDRAGYISNGTITGRRVSMRVMIPADVSSCMFYGRFSAERASGAYSCYAGGSLVEAGVWEAARLY